MPVSTAASLPAAAASRLKVETRIHIAPYFTPQDWQLPAADPVVAAGVAWGLNRTLADYVNRGETREATSRFLRSHMRHASVDTPGPLAFMEQVLDHLFGPAH